MRLRRNVIGYEEHGEALHKRGKKLYFRDYINSLRNLTNKLEEEVQGGYYHDAEDTLLRIEERLAQIRESVETSGGM